MLPLGMKHEAHIVWIPWLIEHRPGFQHLTVLPFWLSQGTACPKSHKRSSPALHRSCHWSIVNMSHLGPDSEHFTYDCGLIIIWKDCFYQTTWVCFQYPRVHQHARRWPALWTPPRACWTHGQWTFRAVLFAALGEALLVYCVPLK